MSRTIVSVIILLILEIVLGFRALYRLFKMRRYIRFTVYVLIWFGYPFLAYSLYLFIMLQEDVHTRMWILMPAMLSSMIWFVFGFTMNKKVKNIERNIDYKDEFSRRRRIIGLIMSVAALLTWIIGFNSYFGESFAFDTLGAFVISLVFWIGTMYLATGKPIEKMDD